MSWETRRNRKYFYRKKRIGGKVKSIYVASDEFGILIDRYEEKERQRLEAEKDAQTQQREKIEEIDSQINEFSEINKSLVDALFLLNGYHQHKRQWRKKT